MNYGRLAILMLSFFLDVHVRAADVTAARGARRTFAFAEARVTLAAGGLTAVEGEALRLVRGRAYVEGPITIATPFARFTCGGECAALFAREDGRVTIESLSDGWTIVRTGDPTEYGVDVATRVIVGAVDPRGRAEVEPPQSLAWADLVRAWSKLYPDGIAAFTARVTAFRPAWSRTVERLSAQHAARAVAMVDAQDAAHAARARREAARAAEDAELRRQFRARNFVAP